MAHLAPSPFLAFWVITRPSYDLAHLYLVMAQRVDTRAPRSIKFWATDGKTPEPQNPATSEHVQNKMLRHLSQPKMEK